MTVYQSTSPAINRRIPINSTISVTFSAALNAASVNTSNIIFEDVDATSIFFTVTLSPSNTINVSPISDLTNDTVYKITLTTAILDSGLFPITQTDINFITEETAVAPIIDLTSDGNVNDILFKNDLLLELFDGRELIETGNKFNFQMVPSEFNETDKTYSNAVNSKIIFDNQTLLLRKTRQQELITFEKFFDTIEEIGTITAAELDNIKKTLLIKSFDINSSSGLTTKIQYILEIFGQTLGLYFVAVEPHPFRPLEYYISTTIPKLHWTSLLRKMLHPVSWVDNYFFIDQTSEFQQDANASTYFNYFQTEQYEWTDNYILGLDDFSLEFKGIRQGFDIHGQNLALSIPVTDSVGTPPISYIPAALEGDLNLEANYTNTLYTTGTGNIIKGGNTLSTNVDLSAFTTNQFASNIGSDTYFDFYLSITEGNGTGFYIITGNTNLTTGNTITINGTFPDTEVGLTFWIVDREGTSQRELLAVLNKIRIKPKFVLPYLQASQLGEILSSPADSRLVFDADGDLQLITVSDSPVTAFVDGDTIFSYDDEAFPVLYVDSLPDSVFANTNEMEFGNTIIQNDVTSFLALSSGRIYEIASMSAPDPNDIQTITFVDDISISIAGAPGLETGHELVISEMADAGNNSPSGTPFNILDYNYGDKTITILNSLGVQDLSPSGTPDAIQTVPLHHRVVTNIIPGTFSLDSQLFNGYANWFDNCVIDGRDFNAMEEFNFQYAEWNAPSNYPKIGGGDTDYDAFVADLNTTSNFDSMSHKGIIKKYYPAAALNVAWELGDKIYEINRIDVLTDLATDVLGTYFGIIEREETAAYSVWEATTRYSVGDRVYGTSASGGVAPNYIFEVVSGTLSGSTEPVWDTTLGATGPSGLDGDITWLTVDQKNVIVKFLNTFVGQVYLEDDSLSTFTDYTKEANDQTLGASPSPSESDDVLLMPLSPAIEDAFYIGNLTKFSSFMIDISTLGDGDWTIIWEYSSPNSTGWTALTINSAGDNIVDFRPSTTGRYDLIYSTPSDWTADTLGISGQTPLYWIRGRISAGSTFITSAKAKQVWINTDFNTDSNIFYSKNETEDELLTSASGGQIVDHKDDFGNYNSIMDRKITLQHTIPDVDVYEWTPTIQSGGTDSIIEFVKNIPDRMSNKYILFGKETAVYDVNLTIELFEKEVTEVTFNADVADSLSGTYFNLYSTDDVVQYKVWYSTLTSGEIEPIVSGATAIQIDITTNDTAAGVALDTQTVLDALNDFDVVIDTNDNTKIIITNRSDGATTDITDGVSGTQTGFTFNTIVEGRSNTEDLTDFIGL